MRVYLYSSFVYYVQAPGNKMLEVDYTCTQASHKQTTPNEEEAITIILLTYISYLSSQKCKVCIKMPSEEVHCCFFAC